MIEDSKKEVGKVISDESKSLLKNLLDKSGNVKQVISDARSDLSNIANKNKETIRQESREMLKKFLYGDSLNVIRNSKYLREFYLIKRQQRSKLLI